MTDKKNEIEVWASWVAVYTPYGSEIKRHGFDNIMINIADHVFDPDGALTKKWGDFSVSGQHDRHVEIEVFEGEDTKGRTIGEFQDDLAAFLGSEGYQGDIVATRRTSLTHVIKTPGVDEDDA